MQKQGRRNGPLQIESVFCFYPENEIWRNFKTWKDKGQYYAHHCCTCFWHNTSVMSGHIVHRRESIVSCSFIFQVGFSRCLFSMDARQASRFFCVNTNVPYSEAQRGNKRGKRYAGLRTSPHHLQQSFCMHSVCPYVLPAISPPPQKITIR